MARADYLLCSVCKGKTIYDAEVNYIYFAGQIAALCSDCATDNELVIVKRINKLDDFTRFKAAHKEPQG